MGVFHGQPCWPVGKRSSKTIERSVTAVSITKERLFYDMVDVRVSFAIQICVFVIYNYWVPQEH